MAKQIILYNLAEDVTMEEYQAYVDTVKGPFFVNLPSVKSYTLIETMGEAPCQFAGIVETDDPAGLQADTQSPAFGAWLREWLPKVKDVQMMFGMEVFQGRK